MSTPARSLDTIRTFIPAMFGGATTVATSGESRTFVRPISTSVITRRYRVVFGGNFTQSQAEAGNFPVRKSVGDFPVRFNEKPVSDFPVEKGTVMKFDSKEFENLDALILKAAEALAQAAVIAKKNAERAEAIAQSLRDLHAESQAAKGGKDAPSEPSEPPVSEPVNETGLSRHLNYYEAVRRANKVWAQMNPAQRQAVPFEDIVRYYGLDIDNLPTSMEAAGTGQPVWLWRIINNMEMRAGMKLNCFLAALSPWHQAPGPVLFEWLRADIIDATSKNYYDRYLREYRTWQRGTDATKGCAIDGMLSTD